MDTVAGRNSALLCVHDARSLPLRRRPCALQEAVTEASARHRRTPDARGSISGIEHQHGGRQQPNSVRSMASAARRLRQQHLGDGPLAPGVVHGRRARRGARPRAPSRHPCGGCGGMLRSVPSTASSTMSEHGPALGVAAGTPSSTTSGSASTLAACPIAASATTTMPAKASDRRSRTGPSSARHQQAAVAEQAAHRGLVDDLGGARRQPHDVAVADRQHLAARPPRARAWRARPDAAPRRAWGWRCAAAPSAYISFSSSRRGWPVTCTSASLSVMSSQPRSTSRFWMRPTARSLPGMVREEKITRSPLSSSMSGCSSSAMRAIAARGSPWLPVHSSHDLARAPGTRTAPGRDT